MVKNKRSFSLIEIIIVVSLIGLFSGLSIASYNRFSQSKKLDEETERLYDVLNLAYKKTMAGDYSGNNSCANFKGYRVVINFPSQYQLQINCNNWITIQTYNLENNNITLSPISTSVSFMPLTGHLSYSITEPVSINLTNSVISKTKTIRIEREGKITKLND